ncbi:MAG: hypothetical protein D6760_04740 [Deltaproteobacteria bacterium]|nr:MAG: hypothetical protein D6760_04740 [Deltaproteobacteria bacterium]
MHVPPVLTDLVVLLTVSLPVVFLCQKLGLPAVVGFVVTGVVIGPSATGLIASSGRVETLAEIGVVLLLFAIGLEVSLASLLRLRRVVLTSGLLQVATTTAVAAAAAATFGLDWGPSLVAGFVVALSSTAVALKTLADRGDADTPHGQLALGVLVFQDIAVLPMLFVLPLLAGSAGFAVGGLLVALAWAAAGVAAIVVTARVVVPLVFAQIVKLGSRELFTGTVMLTCFGTAWLAGASGLSLAIGAFVAGLVVSESEISHQVVAEVLPLRDLFSSIFFVSIGMLVDIPFLSGHLWPLAVAVPCVVGLKWLAGAGAVLAVRRSLRLGLLAGAALAQIGEFSFVLAEEARRAGIFTGDAFQLVVATAAVTIALTPVLVAAAERIAPRAEVPLVEAPDKGGGLPRSGHVVIVGYGLNGGNLARVLAETSIPYCVIDLDGAAVESAREAGHPVLYGDATRRHVLERAHVGEATTVVVAIRDAAATRAIVSLARRMNETAAIVVRTHYVAEIEDLYRLGADEVIPEEFETSVEIFARVLGRLDIPRNVIAAQIDALRAEHYALLRGRGSTRQYLDTLYDIFMAATTITYLVRDGSPAIGRTLDEIGLRRATGATVIAVVRDGRAMANPSLSTVVERGDILVLLGNHAEITAARAALDPPGDLGDAPAGGEAAE